MNAADNRMFEELMAWREDVFRICLGYSRNPADAEDLSQDVYLKALRKVGTIRNPAAARGWLLRIARNTCLDHEKRARLFRLFKKRANVEESRTPARPDHPGDTRKRLDRLKKAIERLPPKQKEIVVLREYGHMTYEELAEFLSIRTGTVMSRLNRARTSISKFMKEAIHE